MKRYLVLHKEVGETPLAAIEKYKQEHAEYRDVSMAYAGRLDPMASGKLLILVGDECKRQEEYHALDKAYDFELLLGAESDTGDVLGLAELRQTQLVPPCSLTVAARALRGPLALPYPRYSSKTVQGKPLFLWTLEGRLDDITVPTAHSTLYAIRHFGTRTLSGSELLADILHKIDSIPPVVEESKKLGADFRREDIRARWRELLEPRAADTFQIATFSCICSSGTYIRSLAPRIAEELGTTGLAFSIHRTHIGKYIKVFRNLGFWIRIFR